MNKYFVAGVFLFLGFTASATTYYVNVANTVGQAAPYSTPATASTTIQAAVNQADYGDTVQVADGYYVLSSEILVTNHMHIVSERGANSTVIDGGDNSRCFNIDIYIDPWIGGEEGELRGFFITNGSGTYGGGVRCGTDTVIADCTFDNNYADDGGGLYGGKAYNCVFTNNIANYEGGGMNGDGSHTAYNCTFVDNFADWNGGGLYGGDADDCIFIENAAQVGAGMCSDGSASRCSFINNIAEYYGGALFGIDTSLGHRSAYSCVASNNTALVSGGGFENVYAYNSLIVSNTAPKGGGAYKSSLKNCTITENSATYGGGVNDCSLQNSIIWYNGCTISGSDFEDCSSITYCCSLLLTHNVDGNITTAPLFINPAAGNYRLASNSTCINAGTNNISILTDLDGNLRRQGIRVDMGAYEASLPENPVYVSVSTGNDENDGQSWSTAKQTIQAAIDIATDTVRVSNGVYLVTSEISSPGAVYIVSANGPEYTTVDGGGVTRCFNLSAFSKLSGFTVTGGTTPVDESGGGIYCDDTITIVTNCIIRSNTASKHGGGMYNGTASYCTFSDNTAHEDGGGMYEGTASYCTFSCNTADEDGGGKNSGSADHCLFTENNADSSGGGMDGEFNGTATECVFSKNTCGSTGGGFAAGEVNRCTFSENIAWTGGGVSSCEINNSVLSGNQAYTGGGMSGGNAVNCTLTDNYATEDGGGAFQGSLKNSVLKANRADDSGGGILACHLANCTLTGNSAAYGGGMCYGDAVNCIIWNNVATLSSNNFYEAELTYCASPEVTNEENHNINQDPLLISPFRISTNSPCIAAGNISETSGSDFDGELWQTPPSIGCDEVVPGSVTGEITLSLSGSTNLAVGTSGNYIIHVTGAITQTILSFSDGDSITNALTSVNHTWNTAGNQSVTFTAFNDDYPTGVSMILPVSVISVAESTICVDGSTGSDSNEGNSWANPKKTIQAGVDAQSIENGWIIVSNGTYAISTAIAVEKPVHIRSLNGLEQTVIEGPGYDLDVLTEDDETAGRCFYLNNNKCILSGLTITGGGVACEEDSSCVVSNCLFIENTAYFGGGMYLGTAINCTFRENTSEAGGGKYGGTAILCTFIDNAAEYSGGGMCEGTANRSLFTGNSAGAGGGMCRGTANSSLFSGNDSMWGGGMYNGTANHCNFIGNRAKQGGGIYNSKVNNCIIWYNEATDEGDNIYAFIYGDHNYYCCSPDLDHGVDGNITNDPLLISAAHISTNSLCIAAGKLLHASPATDYDGESWQSPPAIGCDAVQSGAVAGLINLSIEGPTNTCAGTAASYTPIIHGGVTRTILTFSDGASITNALAPIQHSWTALGSQTISIQAFNDDYPAGLSFILPVQVSSTEAATIYVSELNGSDSNDGSSWATAKQSIQAGVDAQAFYGGQILVTNGTYSVTNEIMITKPIEVISVNGAESTIVDGGNSNRCFNLRNSDCLISGFTITGGYATNDNFHTGSLNGDGGGVYCWGYNPEITECVITENNAASYGGGVYYGRISRSHLSKNTAHNGGALCYSEAESCVIVKNSAIVSDIYVFDHSTGGGVYEGVVVNCTIADNSAEGSGGIYKGEAFNSIIWNNISTNGYSPDFYETYCQSSCSPTLTNNVDGNIYQDPLFISSDNNNYRLPSESPCVDAGANEWVNYSLDFDGGPRIENEAVDMGAFEVNPIYVSDDDGNDSNDGKSWMTAKKTIQAGINAQNILGGIVLVASGTYFPTSTITCSQNVSIIATQGAETTIVNGGGTIPCFNLGETTTLIKGFTITNGVTTGDGLYTGNGGGVYADSFDATLDECIISGNSAVNGGGAHKCTLTRCILRGNTASNDGGALVHSIANNCIIQDNIADYIGGGMYGGTANNCNLINNSAYRSGGIHGGAANNSIIWGNSASNVSNELYNTTTHHSCSPALTPGENGNISDTPGFKNIAAGDYHLMPWSPCIDSGTNLYVETSTDLDGSARIKNDIVDIGVYELAAIYVATTGSDSNDGSSWAKAKVTLQGGVDIAEDGDLIMVQEGTYLLSTKVIITNSVTLYGGTEPKNTIVDGDDSTPCFDLADTATTLSGLTITHANYRAVYCTGLTPVLTNCLITANVGSNGGGMTFGTALDCTFSSNVVSSTAGAMYKGTANNCTFIENSAHSGGAIYSVTASNCTFTANTASWYGGAGYQSTFFNCTLRNNSSLSLGGALYYGTANNCIIWNNSASKHGGGMWYATANNCVFTGNRANYDGGGMCYGTANNCTFTENTAFEGGGINRTTVNNCILWNNSAEEQGDNLRYSTARYSCSPDVTHGSSGCITNNPLLVSASHIATNSPCIGMGSDEYATGTDLDGESWQAPPSMGCDELIGGAVSGPILPMLTISELICQGYNATMELFFEGAVSMTTIDFGDGSAATNMPATLTHLWDSIGEYEVVLTGYNDDHPSGVSITNVVNVQSVGDSAIYVSDATGSDANIGSYDNPKKTIQAGVDAQDVEGSLVFVDLGTYAITSEILIDKNIRLYSQNNADVTTIESDGHARCFDLRNSRCIVNGFTITGSGGTGEDSTGGAIHCSGTRPLVSNCILTENTGSTPSTMQGGTASHCSFINNVCNGWGTMKNGVAEYCTFRSNTSSSGGAIYDCVARFSTFQDNSAQYGGAQYGGKATQCKFIRNTATKYGGAINSGTVINSTIQGNVANEYGGGMYQGTAINCTFCDNRSAKGGGSYSGTIQNCILWNNTATIEGNNLLYGTVSYSCAPELTPGEDGNITTNPLLLSPSHIATNSPCIGVGSALYAEGSDIDGDEWNNPPSMGCDEISFPMQGQITLSLSGPSTICAGFPATFTFIVEGEITQSTVDFDDGSQVYNPITTTIQHTWDTPGPYTIHATALHQDSGWTETSFNVEVVNAAATAIYVATSGSDSAAGTNWPTAKQTIQGGIDAQSLVGGQVIVSNGVYTLEETIQISKTIQLIALSGAEETVIDAVNLYALDSSNSRALEIGDLGCSIDGFTIRNAQTSGTGGAIYCDSTAPRISNCILLNNSAGTAGGMFGGTALDCTFTNCSAITGMGGGLYGGIASNTLFTQNYARNGGAGMYYGIATDCTFIGNEAPTGGYGGGMRGGTATTCTFQSNASGYGGGLADGTANDCNFFENTAIYYGGGARESTLTRCVLIGNTALLGGGGTYSGIANSCLFTANSAEEKGGAMYGGTANHCTITGNRAGEISGGMSNGTVNNCIVWGNTAGISNPNLYSSTAYNTCCPDLTDGSNGCITNNPLLVTASHLSASSPCIGRGSAEYAIGTDIDGEIWQSPPSMGCDEPSLSGAVEMALIGPASIFNGVSADYTALFNGPVNQTIINFADGTQIINAVGPITHSWATPGSYDVVLTAFNNDYPLGTTFTQNINVASSATIIHVALNGNDASNGLSWTTAKATIQAGVDAQSIYGGQVVVSNGTYNLSEAIEINTPIHLLGHGINKEVLIDAGGSSRCFNLGYEACILDNLMITNGATATQGYNTNIGGGINCVGHAPVITNCWITGCLSYWGGGIYKGTVIDSALMGNTAAGYGGALSGSRVFHSALINNHAVNGGAAYDAQLDRCLISGNIASTDGGGLNYSIAQNCDIRNNTATNYGGGSHNSTLKNCTIVENSANYGGGIHGGDTLNCIVWYNNASRYTNMSSNAESSCSPDLKHLYSTDNNITNAPAFINRAGGDYRLSHYSPCLNTGDNQYVTTEKDFDDEQRIQYGVVDMGAYEVSLGNDDSDGDGMPDSWELENFGNITIADATEDADIDSFDNHSEYIAGTDPHNDKSLFLITQIETEDVEGNTEITLQWNPSIQGRTYGVMWSTNLVDGFILRQSSDYPINSTTIENDLPNSYYKISVRLDD